jgi:hypothetical protein
MLSNFTISGLVFLLTLVFGLWLSRSGRPYNSILFNIHKLITLGGVIYAGWQFSHWLKAVDAPLVLTVLLVFAALCVIAIFASGGLLSAGKLDYALMLLIHRVGIAALVVTFGVVVYWLGKAV